MHSRTVGNIIAEAAYTAIRAGVELSYTTTRRIFPPSVLVLT
ncbi:hypothetical protein SAMN04489842_0863 [Natronobacterium texcoconense]|uniref:Uncharacterized protein n=1 Tax=Natronobacterium texcoconense TaxID=1095778 RepID=A0A1H1AZ45_NATTX|nr:hypothetical protein SAMN04489842_0863 [Natronobacterium texcoconense]